MDSDSTWQLILFMLLIAASAFFSASETALMSLSKIRIRQLVDDKVKGAATIDKLLKNSGKLLSTILVGNNIANIAASALMTSLAIKHFGSGGVGLATGAVTILVLIFAEITPKSMASKYSEKISLKVCSIVYFLTIVLSPFTSVFTYIANFIVKFFGGNAEIKPFITEDELRTMVDVSHEEGVLEIEEREMIYNVFEFGDSLIKDVMTQRKDITAINISSSYEEIENIIKRDRYSRMPVYSESMDNVIGILHIKDVYLRQNKSDFNLNDIMREPYYTYEFKKISEVFKEMKKNKTYIAVVLDEYGGTAGLVTIEDLIEEIVGDIEDEYDEEIREIVVIKEDEYIVLGEAKLDTINDLTGTIFESEDCDTIGGLIINSIGRLPKHGEKIEMDDVKFIVEQVDKKSIKKVKMFT